MNDDRVGRLRRRDTRPDGRDYLFEVWLCSLLLMIGVVVVVWVDWLKTGRRTSVWIHIDP